MDQGPNYKIQPSERTSVSSPKGKELKKMLYFQKSLHSFDSPAVSIFSSSGLELQLGHPIRVDLQQEFEDTSNQ